MHCIFQLKDNHKAKQRLCLVLQLTTDLLRVTTTTPNGWKTTRLEHSAATLTATLHYGWVSSLHSERIVSTRTACVSLTLHFLITSYSNIRSVTPPLFLSLFRCLYSQNTALYCIYFTVALKNKFHRGCGDFHLLYWNVRICSTLCKKKPSNSVLNNWFWSILTRKIWSGGGHANILPVKFCMVKTMLL